MQIGTTSTKNELQPSYKILTLPNDSTSNLNSVKGNIETNFWITLGALHLNYPSTILAETLMNYGAWI